MIVYIYIYIYNIDNIEESTYKLYSFKNIGYIDICYTHKPIFIC